MSAYLSEHNSTSELTYHDKAAIILYILGPENSEEIFDNMTENEHRTFARALHSMSYIAPQKVEAVLNEFIGHLDDTAPVKGGLNEAKRFMSQILPADAVNKIIEDIEENFDSNIWDRISNAPEALLSNYLKMEQDQTIAVILSRIKPEKAARIFTNLPDEKGRSVLRHMSKLGAIEFGILEDIQDALRQDFMSALMRQSSARKPPEIIAAILNSVNSERVDIMLDDLRDLDKDVADNVQKLMFTFGDFLTRIAPDALQKIIREVEGGVLIKALKMAKQKQPEVYDYFLDNMSKRAAEMIVEEIENFGPLKAREAEEAQTLMIQTTREMAKAGLIEIMEASSEGEGDSLL